MPQKLVSSWLFGGFHAVVFKYEFMQSRKFENTPTMSQNYNVSVLGWWKGDFTNKQSRSFCDCSVWADLFRLLRLVVPFVGSSTP